MRDHEEEEAHHEAVTVVQPVRALHSVPHNIKRGAVEADKHEREEYAGCNFLAGRDVLHEEVERHEHKRKHSRIQERKSLGTHGIVRSEVHLRDHIEEIELLPEAVNSVLPNFSE